MEARYPDGPLEASLARLHGFFSSVVSGPLIRPSEWMEFVFGGDEGPGWEAMEQANRAYELLMRLYTEVSDDLAGKRRRDYRIIIDRIGRGRNAVDFADDWCIGYLTGVALREAEWRKPIEDPKLSVWFEPMLAITSPDKAEFDAAHEPEAYSVYLEALPVSAVKIYDWWREEFEKQAAHQYSSEDLGTFRRASPKISPNAACPCGSGKKYKRCCSALRAV
jgi:uncharacterized protein